MCLNESETPYSKAQIYLVTVMKTKRFAFVFAQWEHILNGVNDTTGEFSVLLKASLPKSLSPIPFLSLAFPSPFDLSLGKTGKVETLTPAVMFFSFTRS